MMMLVRRRRQPGWTRRVGQTGKADRQQDWQSRAATASQVPIPRRMRGHIGF